MPESTGTDTSSLSQQAAEWAVCLSGDQVSHQQRADFEAWLAQDPCHQEAYAQINLLWHSVTPRRKRSHAGIKALLSIVLLLLSGLYAFPLSEWLADERTRTGEIRRITLADGSHITLDSDSAMDIAFDGEQRRVILHRGRLLAEVASDLSTGKRPFIVESRDGTARALGTKYIVEQTRYNSIVDVIESQVAVASRANPRQFAALQPGQSIRFDSKSLYQPEASSSFVASWAQARLVYQDAPLDQVITDLARYRNGFLKISREAGQLRFTGVLPADDPEAALNILENALPVHARQHSRWFIWVDIRT